MPLAVMVPVMRLPPLTSSTAQETEVSLAPATVAANVWVFPKSSELAAGVTTIVIAEGVGIGVGIGGGTAGPVVAVLPAQPWAQIATGRQIRISNSSLRCVPSGG